MNETSLYKTPQASLSTNESSYPVATMGWRLITMLIDVIGFYALAFAVGLLCAIMGIAGWIEGPFELLAGLALYLLYFIPQEALTGRTLGKLVAGTRVQTIDGDAINLKHAVLRTLIRLIPFEVFSFLAEQQPRGWHDKWSGTKVVQTRKDRMISAPAADAQEK